MLMQQTLNKLAWMKLGTMARAYRQQAEDPTVNGLAFDDRLGLLVDAEWTSRQNKHLDRLLKKAGMRFNGACVEDVEYLHGRQLDRHLIQQLATGTWISEGLNLVLHGLTGTGKTYVGCALGHSACRNNYSVLYRRVPRLMTDLAISRGDGSYNRLMKELKKIRLLILDDWGINTFGTIEGRDLLEVIEDRSGTNSTLVVSQISPDLWHNLFEDPTVADAVMDRLIHSAYTIEIKGPSMRKLKSPKKDDHLHEEELNP
jgi:DNA replication protein DnaC